jgi:hypothetical protein
MTGDAAPPRVWLVAGGSVAVAGVAVATPHHHRPFSSFVPPPPYPPLLRHFSLPHQAANPLFISIKPIKPFKQQQKAHMSTENIQNLK